MYAITETGWRAIDDASELHPGETLAEDVPQAMLDAVASAEARRQRDVRLRACDWTQVSDAPLTVEQRAAWAAYRQALRDMPEQPGFPDAIDWPQLPSD